MPNQFISLGLMSGTSVDGVDASIIQSDGVSKYNAIFDKYFEYDNVIKTNIHKMKDKIRKFSDLENFREDLKILEKEITIFHSKAVEDTLKTSGLNIDFIGFHGQTIYHNSNKKISKQLGDGHLLSNLTKKTVVFDFRKNDLINGGEGAPLIPVFHKLLVEQHKFKLPLVILNIGGITNFTFIGKENSSKNFYSADIGPGNCLIDEWIKKNSNKDYDKNGSIAKSGDIDKIILNQAIESWEHKFDSLITTRSFDVKDFDLSFVRGLSLPNGAATLTEYTSHILSNYINKTLKEKNIIVCGGGRKNQFLIEDISQKIGVKLQMIDDFGVDGDFVESSGFAYIAIRSYLNLPLSFPETTGCSKPSNGGVVVKY